ncbi:MAG: DUF433 domain-containing protein [Phycisphaerales bacterium]|nr:DUF433 domain-containing protein [Phycisphaerales bacterium]
MNWEDHITVVPNVCHGNACIRGTRVMVSVILDDLAAGESPDDMARAYRMPIGDLRPLLHATGLVTDRIVPFSIGD